MGKNIRKIQQMLAGEFGKKSQVSGIMVKDTHSKVFEVPKRLSVTFDGDLVDMIRCKYIIRAIENDNLLDNVNKMGKYFANKLAQFDQIKNIRQTGLLIAFDFEDKSERDTFYKNLYKNGMICNPTRDKSIRLRPNLNVTKQEINDALNKISKSF